MLRDHGSNVCTDSLSGSVNCAIWRNYFVSYVSSWNAYRKNNEEIDNSFAEKDFSFLSYENEHSCSGGVIREDESHQSQQVIREEESQQVIRV